MVPPNKHPCPDSNGPTTGYIGPPDPPRRRQVGKHQPLQKRQPTCRDRRRRPRPIRPPRRHRLPLPLQPPRLCPRPQRRQPPHTTRPPLALVIANARRHREERRARTGLETLVNTTPVGVLVFDARTGAPVSLNREARRIVNDLCAPGGSAEQLLEVLTFRRADGREVSLEEFPLAQALSTGETVRAEEIVLQAPDGRSVTTLINATSIRSEEGEVESAIVTMQDMTPMEELERLRAEFLGMVSHELRTPADPLSISSNHPFSPLRQTF